MSQVNRDRGAKILRTSRLTSETGEPPELAMGHGTGEAPMQRNSPQAENDALSSALDIINSSALSASNLKLHAQPWTTVAGDGLVSELLSSFFAYESCYYLPFVDQECFLNDMQAGEINIAEFCSPSLVNAICALRCVSLA